MERGSPEYWDWFYDAGREWMSKPMEERRRDVEERWDPELVLNQDRQMPGTAGTFHGYEGLAEANRELYEAWGTIHWQPREVHELDDDRYLVLLEVGGRGRASGMELTGGEIGHVITFRGDRVAQMDVHLGWDAAREAVGFGFS